MSFTYGPFDSDDLGLIATLRDLPSLAGLQLETLEAPGTDGVTLGGTTRTTARFTFDVIIEGRSPAEAIAKADWLAYALDPARGERDLTAAAVPGWRWRSIVPAPIQWARMTWDTATGFKLRADVSFDVLEVYGRPLVDDEWAYAGPGSRTVTRERGNARSYPTVELLGTLTAAQTVTVTVGDVVVTVAGPLADGELLRLDYEGFEFGRWVDDRKVASAVRAMSTLDRPELWPATATRFVVATTGTITLARLRANSRRQ